MRRIKKFDAIIPSLLTILALAFLYSGCSQIRSNKIEQIEDSVIERLLLKDVFFSPSVRSENWLQASRNARLSDYSDRNRELQVKLALDSKRKLTNANYELSSNSHDAIHYYLNHFLARDSFHLLHYPISPFYGPHLDTPKLLTSFPIESRNDIENYIEFLKQIEEQFGGLIDGLESRRKQQVVLPKFLIQQVILQCDSITFQQSSENTLFVHFKSSLNKIGIMEPTSKQNYLDECLNVINESVYPAYLRLSSYLRQLDRNAVNVSGVWQFDHGTAFYKHCVKLHSGTNEDVESLYQVGKIELNRIEGEINILQQLGVADELRTSLTKDSAALAPKHFIYNYLCDNELIHGYETFFRICSNYENEIVSISSLKEQRFAVLKLLVDVGIHHKKWLRSQAIEFVKSHSERTESGASQIVDKAIAKPGKNTSHAITFLKLLELKADERLTAALLRQNLEQNGVRPLPLIIDDLE